MNYFMSLGKGKRNGHQEIDETKLPLLKEIVEQTGSYIVLSSTWRQLDETEHEECTTMYKYLTDRLAKYDLKIMSKTPVIHMNRPLEIKTWLDKRVDKDQIRFISLDDDWDYESYEDYGIGNCLVKTTFYGDRAGLQPEHVKQVIEILNRKDD